MVHLNARDRIFGCATGYLLDQLLGEPGEHWHPLVVFGRLMAVVERVGYRDRRAAGVAYLVSGAAVGVTAGSLLGSTAGATMLACGGRALVDAAGVVDRALAAGDLGRARTALGSLVGRDTDDLDEQDIARAVVESVAENTVDAVIAPMFWACRYGPGGALGYRAVNTLDAIVGYRTKRYARFGWASARCDDLLNFVPARLTALLVMLARPCRAREVLRTVWRDAPAHPSPNAGVAEAAFAAALGVRLGGDNSYAGRVEHRGVLGSGRSAERVDFARAERLSRDVGVLFVLGTVASDCVLRVRAIRNVCRQTMAESDMRSSQVE